MSLLLVVALAAGAGGCASEPETPDEVEPVFELPEDWHRDVDEAEPLDRGWCADFGEPELGELIERVLKKNLDVRAARSRVERARALLDQQRSRRHPQVSLQGEVDGRIGREGWEADYEASIPAAYEVDLWNRIGAGISAAEFDAQAVRLDLAALKLALASETAEQYYELARIRSELELIDEQIRIAKTFLELTEVRRTQGMASGIDVVQQRQQIDELRELRRRAELDEELALNSLATLLGRAPGRIEAPDADDLPEKLPPVPETLPADLLEQRPDIRGARLRVVAADRRIDQALAERLPRLQLTPGLLAEAMSPTGLFDFLFVTAVGTLIQPLWQGGLTRARIEEREAIADGELMAFSTVLLEAIREVEDTLSRGDALYDILRAQRRQLDSAEEALELARAQYRAGMLDYLRVLTALQSVQELELAELESRRVLLSQRIQLCRMLGGDWEVQMEGE